MPIELSAIECRVLGALIEKDMSTPEYYPLSLNALTNACNQKTNRDPVTAYADDDVAAALDSLRHKGLSLRITGPDMRVPKFAHRASETLNLGNRELAVLAALLLRGPQTLGEIKERAQRLYPGLDDLDAAESCLRRLIDREPEPLASRLPPGPGMREARFAHTLSGEVPAVTSVPAEPPASTLTARVAALEAEISQLRERLEQFIKSFT